MVERQKDSKKKEKGQGTINLTGFTSEDKFPDMAVYALDRAGKPLEISKVNDEGSFRIPEKVVEKAHRIVIGPEVEDIAGIERKVLTLYRSEQFKQIMEVGGIFEIPKKDWYGWIQIKRCVSGSVRHCYPYPWFIKQLELNMDAAMAFRNPISPATATDKTLQPKSDALIAKSFDYMIKPDWCETVCDGLVEVYRRTCCCWPWIIDDPRLPELIEELEEILPDPPEIKWPPRPEPDPVPFHELAMFKKGALDKKVVNARQDLYALRTLPKTELVAYINDRPYLFCTCGSATKVADGFIHPDGEFHICWYEWPYLMLINCHEEYAYKVKQNIEGSTVTIYDGVASNEWFHYDDFAKLSSYHPDALSCRHNDFPGEGAFALLQDIGLTGSWRLKTPDATGWDQVGTPAYNDGLAYPAANAAAAVGKYLDRNWGGMLRLRYHFSEEMKGIGAKYYRVSVVASDANGQPTGSRTYLSPNQWKYYEKIGSDIYVLKASLGPNSAGGNNHLYKIPYDADRDWQSGQYHAMLDTRDFANGRFLLTVEVFDNAGNLIRPMGTPDPGGSVQGGFTYRRWYQETGPTAEVPYAALTHMLWWDNRKAQASIVDFRVNGSANTAQCQFLENTGTANFSVGYRAYHPEPMFMLDHRLWWRRGLGGPSGVLTSPHPNPNNVGVPPAPAHQSGSDTFADMLDSHAKCTFTINLHTNVKTFNGIGTLNGLDDWDYGSMALEIV